MTHTPGPSEPGDEGPGDAAEPAIHEPEFDWNEIDAFWRLARRTTWFGRHNVPIDGGPWAGIEPPLVVFGDTPERSARRLALVLDGTRTATAVAVWELSDAGLPVPRRGDLAILVDGGGHPRALVRTASVRRVPLRDVDADHVAAEGEVTSVAEWLAAFTDGLRRRGGETSHLAGPDTEVVLERFEVRFPPPPRATAGSEEPTRAPGA